MSVETEELIAHAPDAIIFADCAGVIRLWNRAAETMFGHGAEEAIGQTLDLIVPKPYRVAHWAGFSDAVTQGRFAKDDALLTSRALTRDGRIIAVELSAAIVRSPSGQVQGIMAIGRDVTERRAREQVQHERIASLERQMAALAEVTASAAEGGARGTPSGPVCAGWLDIVPAEAHDPLTGAVRPQWLVTCSCGWSRECISRWAAESVVKLHPRLSPPGIQHTVTIEEPPADAPPGEQLPLT